MAGKLTNLKVERARHTGHSRRPVRMTDGDGLFLQVTKEGAKSWVYRFTLAGKAREMGLGSLSDVTLANARSARDSARARHRCGVDPIDQKTATRRADAEIRTQRDASNFRTIAAQMIEMKEAGWKNPKHRQQWRNTIATYVNPVIGNLSVAEISTEHVLEVLKPIWNEKPTTANRVRGRIEAVLSHAKTRKLRSGENPATWRDHLSNILPPPNSIQGKEPEHFPALPWKQIGAFVEALRLGGTLSATALEFLIHTACRTNEALGARWNEIDLEEAVWTLPKRRTKATREHRIPLSEPAMALLRQVEPLARGRDSYVFPSSSSSGRLSDMTLLMLIRRMNEAAEENGTCWIDGQTGERIVPHGFRSSFRDWGREYSAWPDDLGEAALAHVISDKASAAYARGDLFEKRRLMMGEWSDYCMQLVR